MTSDSPPRPESPRWRLADQIAFECALAYDEQEDWARLKKRDQAIARAIAPAVWAAPERGAVARRWLTERLRQSAPVKLAADSLLQTLGVAGQLLAVLGAALGLTSAMAALAYTGREPINVSAFFGIFILLQALLALVLLLPFLLPQSLRIRMLAAPLPRLARFLFGRAVTWTHSLAGRYLEARHRGEAAEIAGLARRRLLLRHRLFRWLAFSKLQTAALCFNLGALVSLLLAVAFSDRAFGWQTTLDVSSESVQTMAQVVATPWAWLYGEGMGYPRLEEVEGSRIVLKEGARALRNEDLVAWWRFLALGIATYGILPRLLLWALGGWQMGRELDGYAFDDGAAQSLFDRLIPHAPRFDVEAVRQSDPDLQTVAGASVTIPPRTDRFARALVDKDLASNLDTNTLRLHLAKRWNLAEANVDLQLYESGQPEESAADLDADRQCAIVMESWMPPIRETERQLRTLRAALGERRLIRVVLLGMPEGDSGGLSLSPEPRHVRIWDAFTRRQGDPYLILDHTA